MTSRRPTGFPTRRPAIAALSLLSMGCFQYKEVRSGAGTLPATTYVRVELTDAGSSNVAKAIGPYILYLEGPMESADDNSLSMHVQLLRRRGEADTRWTGDVIRLDRGDMRTVTERQFSRRRTIIASSVFVTTGLALLIAIAKGTGLFSGGTGRPPIQGT